MPLSCSWRYAQINCQGAVPGLQSGSGAFKDGGVTIKGDFFIKVTIKVTIKGGFFTCFVAGVSMLNGRCQRGICSAAVVPGILCLLK